MYTVQLRYTVLEQQFHLHEGFGVLFPTLESQLLRQYQPEARGRSVYSQHIKSQCFNGTNDAAGGVTVNAQRAATRCGLYRYRLSTVRVFCVKQVQYH